MRHTLDLCDSRIIRQNVKFPPETPGRLRKFGEFSRFGVFPTSENVRFQWFPDGSQKFGRPEFFKGSQSGP